MFDSAKTWLRAGVVAAVVAAAAGTAAPALAAGEAPTPPKQEWSFQGIFGTFDKASAQRGLQVYREVCSACHGLDHLAFRHLEMIGYTEDEVKALAAEYQVQDGPDEFGEMFLRPGEAADFWPNPFPNEQAARAANGGAYPPDLSMISKARKYGADYVAAFLAGYPDEPPADVTLLPGQYYNEYMAGHVVAMPNVLWPDGVVYADGTPATVEQQARDVAHFLTWAAEPTLEVRKQTGVKVMLFLFVFTGMMYAVKRKVWQDQH